MSTKIEWADEVWNPVTGCTKVSQGCKHCYAERMSKRLAGRFGYSADDPFKVTLHPDKLGLPNEWRKPRRVFVCSMGDLFHEDVPDNFIRSIWLRMAGYHWHQYMVLTKRPERMLEIASTSLINLENGEPFIPGNIWLGVSAEDQKTANERIPVLLQTPAAHRFVSCEPLLGPIDLTHLSGKEAGWNCNTYDALSMDVEEGDIGQLDLVIVGGESGPGARPMHPEWARSLRDQCEDAGVPFFFKQWGRYTYSDRMFDSEIRWVNKANGWMSGLPSVVCVDMDGKSLNCGADFMAAKYPVAWGWYEGKKAAGRLLDGREWNGEVA